MPNELWTLSTYQQQLARGMREEDLLEHILALARRLGWLAYHTRDSRRSAEGWPDVVLCNGDRLIITELKSARGTLTEQQALWLEMLQHTGKAEVYIWRPADLPQIAEILQGKGLQT